VTSKTTCLLLTLDPNSDQAESEVEQIKRAYSALTKALDEAHPHYADANKQMKKVPQHSLGAKMMTSAMENFDSGAHPNGFGYELAHLTLCPPGQRL
jgi:hypothetical protein